MSEAGPAPFGRLLRDFRLAAGLSQEDLAQRARMSAGGISVLERGARRAPHRDTVALLAAGLGLSSSDRGRLEAASIRPPQPRRRAASSAAGAMSARHNLPFALTRFLGRERMRAAVQTALSEHRLVTLTGPGGVGKTRLALETAHGLVERFPDGVWLVELAPLGESELVVQRVAATLGVPQRFETASSDEWIGELAEKCLLVVLDNCEHVLDASAAVAQRILERCRFIRILATSREALRISGECVVRLDPLELPASSAGEGVTPQDLRASPAVTLFFDRAHDVAPDFAIAETDDAGWRALQAVCVRLDGLPLAIELAAARMNAMSLETLAGALEHRFHLQTPGARTASPRHKTLRALFDWSYGLLTDAERRVFRRLAVFADGWTLEAAESACLGDGFAVGELLTIHSSLVEKSLVVVDARSGSSRYQMLETTHAFALEHLTDRGEYPATARAHAEYFRSLLEKANAGYGKPSLSAWLAELEPELDNLRAALRWSLVDGHDVALGATIAASQHAVLELLSLSSEGARWCAHALAALGPACDPRLEAPLELALCTFYSNGGFAAKAAAAAIRAAELYRTLPDAPSIRNLSGRASLAFALAFAGWAHASLGHLEEADLAATEAAAVAREVSETSVQAWALVVKSLTIAPTDIVARRALLGEALELGRSVRGSLTFGLALIGFGLAEFDSGDFRRARTYAHDARDYYRKYGLAEYLAITALSLSALSALADDDVAGARADAREALTQAHRASRGDLSSVLHVSASIAARNAQPAAAARLLGGSDRLFAELDRPRPPPIATLYDQTLERLGASASRDELEVWIAEGRHWSFEECVAAALRV
jgi:non-specific serine/threonine protein kinase